MAFVYHIHLPEDKGNLEVGYIGFTSKTVEQRWKEHLIVAKSKTRNYPLYNALNKYSTIVITTLVEGDVDYCLDIEYRLRPTPNTGWNINVGGQQGGLGIIPSADTREKMRKAHSEERRKARSEYMLSLKSWENGFSNPTLWSIADKLYLCHKENPEVRTNIIARAFNTEAPSIESILGKILDGWNPSEDTEWVQWSSTVDKHPHSWKSGDPKLSRKKVEYTLEELKVISERFKNRVWTDEQRQAAATRSTGFKHSEDTKRILSEKATGRKRPADYIEKVKQKSLDCPWTNGKAKKNNWLRADEILKVIEEDCDTLLKLHRHFEYPDKSGTLTKIFRKIKNGWNPTSDPFWLEFKETYKEAENV